MWSGKKRQKGIRRDGELIFLNYFFLVKSISPFSLLNYWPESAKQKM